MKMSTVLAMHQ